mmetsp:Transcript_1108/g.2540  ORF Transcript_1108/g.2540 Transcript_1108/m.2540 type:complete len:349 (+) Transcript_1108:247-1293(+)
MDLVKETKEFLSLFEVWIGRRYTLEQGLNEGLQHADLIFVCGVHYIISLVLKREDPRSLSASYVVPHCQRPGCRISSEHVVSTHSTEKAAVSALDGVCLVNCNGSDRGEEHFENLFACDRRRVVGIQGVDALNDEDSVFGNFEWNPIAISITGLHIVLWYINLSALDQRVNVLVDQVDIHALNVVIVDVRAHLASLVPWLPVQGQIIMVHRQWVSWHTLVSELMAQFRSKCGFSTGCRAGDTHNTNSRGQESIRVLAITHCPHNIDDSSLLHELRGEDEVLPVPVVGLEGVQVADTGDTIMDPPLRLGFHTPNERGLRLVVRDVRQKAALISLRKFPLAHSHTAHALV